MAAHITCLLFDFISSHAVFIGNLYSCYGTNLNKIGLKYFLKFPPKKLPEKEVFPYKINWTPVLIKVN